jgi:2-polyprenyl-6-hydroxyphenyl methylase/3-demethylubiquinone-9 3-methyltransferase
MTLHSAYHNYTQADPPHQPLYLDLVIRYLTQAGARHVLDAGCGDGNFAASLHEAGFTMYGIDSSPGGIAKAQSRYPSIRFANGSIYEEMPAVDAIICIEVIEHLYSPVQFVRRARAAIKPGGLFIVTTPYWGYLKNVLLALTNRIDRAVNPLWEGGHIKHFSYRTLRMLLEQNGFDFVAFHGVGRPIPYCWRGMLMVARRLSVQSQS